MKFKVVNNFEDTLDDNKLYEAGDPYPKGDYKPTKKRIAELSKIHPKYKRVFIEEVKEKHPEPPKGKENGKQETYGEKTSGPLTEADLKKMHKDPQELLIKTLGGNPDEAKNEAERIALILSLQEKQKEQNAYDNQEPSPDK